MLYLPNWFPLFTPLDWLDALLWVMGEEHQECKSILAAQLKVALAHASDESARFDVLRLHQQKHCDLEQHHARLCFDARIMFSHIAWGVE